MIEVTCPKCGFKDRLSVRDIFEKRLYSDPHNPDLESYQCISCRSLFPFVGTKIFCEDLSLETYVDQDGTDVYIMLGIIGVPLRLVDSFRTKEDLSTGFEDIKEYRV